MKRSKVANTIPIHDEIPCLTLYRRRARTLSTPRTQGNLISSIMDGQYSEAWQWSGSITITGHITVLAIRWTAAPFAKHTLL